MNDLSFADRGDSSIVGTVLVIAIVVALGVVLAYFVFSTDVPDTTPPSVSVTQDSDGSVTVEPTDMGTAESVDVDVDECIIVQPNGDEIQIPPEDGETADRDTCTINDPSEVIIIPGENVNPDETIQVTGDHGEQEELVRDFTPSDEETTTTTQPNFESPDAPASVTVTEGETLKIDTTIENSGDDSGWARVYLTNVNDDLVDGSSDTKMSSKVVEIEAGETAELSESNGNALELDTSSTAADNEPYTVDVAVERMSGENPKTTGVTVNVDQAAMPDYTVDIQGDDVEPKNSGEAKRGGNTLVVPVKITNNESATATDTTYLDFANNVADKTDSSAYSHSKTFTTPSNGSTIVEFEVTPASDAYEPSVNTLVENSAGDQSTDTKEISLKYDGPPPVEWCNAYFDDSASGSGTTSTPYKVSTVQHLQCMGAEPSAHYKLTSTVSAHETTSWTSNMPDGWFNPDAYTPEGFDPIGYSGNYLADASAFTGSLNGNGYDINGLYINRSASSNPVGLFANVGSGATIENVTMNGLEINGSDNTGGLAGTTDSATITNVTLDSPSVTGSNSTGGLVGSATATTITDATLPNGTVDGTNQVGGVVGVTDSGTITGADIGTADSSPAITGETQVGGIAGILTGTVDLTSSTVTNTTVDGVDTGDSNQRAIGGAIGQTQGTGASASDLTVENTTVAASNIKYVGGIVGAHGSTDGVIEQSDATSIDVTGTIRTGGVAGRVYDGATLDTVASSGTVTGTDAVGGAVGRANGSSTTIVHSSSSATVNGEDYVGGFAGYLYNSVDLVGSYSTGNSATGDVTATGHNAGGFAGAVTDVRVYESSAEGRVEGSSHVGGLIGTISGTAHVENANASGGEVVNTSEYTGDESGTYKNHITGGLVAKVGGDSLVEKSESSKTVTSTFVRTGGLVGHINGTGKILDSTASGKVSGDKYTGGLVGFVATEQASDSYTIKNSSASGSVNGSGKVGGLVGATSNDKPISNALITGSAVSGNVEGQQYVGGLAGLLHGESSVEDSDVTGSTVTMDGSGSLEAMKTGGAFGAVHESTTVDNVSFDGTVEGGNYDKIGGLIGELKGDATVSNSSTAGTVTNGHTDVGGVVGYGENVDISGTTSSATVEGRLHVGGLVGKLEGTSSVEDSAVNGGTVTALDTDSIVEVKAGGAFGAVQDSATITNVSFDGTVDGGNYDKIGGIAGELGGDVTIANSSSAGTVTNGRWYVGGVVGHGDGSNIEVTNTDSSATVNGRNYVGGLVGYMYDGITITGGTASGDVTGSGHSVGGVAGTISDATVTDVSATGSVDGASHVGGFAGMVGGTTTLDNVSASGGMVTNNSTYTQEYDSEPSRGQGYTGGLLGNAVSDVTVKNSSASNNVESSYGYAGGLLGKLGGSSQIDNSSASGDVTVTATDAKHVGGLVGWLSATHTDGTYGIRDSYYENGTINGYNDVGGIVGITANASDTLITGSYVDGGTISGTDDVGGLGGKVLGSTVVEDSYAINNTVEGSEDVGGLIGQFQSSPVRGSYTDNTVRGDSNTGGLVGYVTSNATVENSYSHSTVETKDSATTWADTGGLVGELHDGGAVTGSYATGSVTGTNNTGGLVGVADGSGPISDSYAEGDVSGNRRVGGLVGQANSGDIQGSHYDGGTVTATGSSVGGLVGYSNAEVSTSHALGTKVSGPSETGGLVGQSIGGTVTESYANITAESTSGYAGGLVGYTTSGATISDAYAQGDVLGQDTGGIVGALANSSDQLERAYATGSVEGTGSNVGGVVGYANGTSTISAQYWNTTTTGTSTPIGNQSDTYGDTTGLTDSAMTGDSAASNMSFVETSGSVWKTVSGDYPALAWE